MNQLKAGEILLARTRDAAVVRLCNPCLFYVKDKVGFPTAKNTDQAARVFKCFFQVNIPHVWTTISKHGNPFRVF